MGSLAIMQPYFMPYAGYFRLFAATDLFVVYDCVQFPRRGWVHRNRLLDDQRRPAWLTLPLAHADFDAPIAGLSFRPDAATHLADRMRRFPALRSPAFLASDIHGALMDLRGTPLDYLERLMAHVCQALGLPFRVVRSSSLGLPASLRGQDRILAILKELGGTSYLNSPGGHDLYSTDAFAEQGIQLHFLPPWEGDFSSMLQRLPEEPATRLAADIRRQCPLELKGVG